MKKRSLNCRFFMLILCILCFSIPKVVLGQTPEQNAISLFNNNKGLLLREDIRLLLPTVLETFRDPGLQRALKPETIDRFLSNPTFLRSFNSEIEGEFIGLLSTDIDLRNFFRDENFYHVLKDTKEIDELITEIRDAPTTPKTLEIVSENPQQGNPNTSLESFIIEVKDLYGEPPRPADNDGKVHIVFTINVGSGILSTNMDTVNKTEKTLTVVVKDGKAECTLTLGTHEGIILVEARVKDTDLTQIFTAVAVSTTPITPQPLTLEIFGNGQSDAPGTTLKEPLVVVVKDQNGEPVANVNVTFSVIYGDGRLSDSTLLTNVDGQAETTLTLGEDLVTLVEASVEGISEKHHFLATTTRITPPPLTLEIVSGNGQSGKPDTILREPLVVVVKDQEGNGIEDVDVTFRVTSGDGQLSNLKTSTNEDGQAETTLTIRPNEGITQVTATVEFEDPSTGKKTMLTQTFTAAAILAVPTVPIVYITPPTDKNIFKVGDEFTLNLNFVNVEIVTRFKTTVQFDPEVFEYVGLKSDLPFNAEADIDGEKVVIDGEINETTNVLAGLTFRVKDPKTTKLTLSEVILNGGDASEPYVLDRYIIFKLTEVPIELIDIKPENTIPEDVNIDGLVNILDLVQISSNFSDQMVSENRRDVNNDGIINILDLVKVASKFGLNLRECPVLLCVTE